MSSKPSKQNKPDGWSEIALHVLGHTFAGLTGKSKNHFGSGDPYVSYMNVYSNPRINPSMYEYVQVSPEEKQNSLQYGDVIFTTSSETADEVGVASVFLEHPESAIYLNSFCFGLRLNDQKVMLPEYAQYYFRGPVYRDAMTKIAQGASRYNLSKKYFLATQVIIPNDSKEQKRIVAVLEVWDKTVELLTKKIELKKQVKKGLMQKLLTGQTRLLGFTEKWAIKKLGEASVIKKGDSITRKNVTKGDIPVIAGGQQPAYYHNVSNRTGKTITVSASGAYAGYVDFYSKPIFVSDCTSIKESDVNIDFIYLYLKFRQQYIYSLQSGGAQPHVQPKDIFAIKISVPESKKEQSAIADILTTADKEIKTLERKLKNLKEQKRYLLNNLITGAIRTPENLKINI